jgi:hypothetical protein
MYLAPKEQWRLARLLTLDSSGQSCQPSPKLAPSSACRPCKSACLVTSKFITEQLKEGGYGKLTRGLFARLYLPVERWTTCRNTIRRECRTWTIPCPSIATTTAYRIAWIRRSFNYIRSPKNVRPFWPTRRADPSSSYRFLGPSARAVRAVARECGGRRIWPARRRARTR